MLSFQFASKQPSELRDYFVQIVETATLKSQALGLRHAEAAQFGNLIHRVRAT